MFHPNKKTTFLPRILQVQWFKVISETSFSVPYNSHKAKVPKFLIFVQRSFLALEDDGHVELLDDQVHHLPRRGARGHGDLHTGALGKTWEWVLVNK